MVSVVEDTHEAVETIWEWILQENRAHPVTKKLPIVIKNEQMIQNLENILL